MLVALESRSVAATGPAVRNVEKPAMNAPGLHKRREGEFSCLLYCRLLLDASHVRSITPWVKSLVENAEAIGPRYLAPHNFTG